ncbi:glycine zipper domain-containing protein [Paraburkholderia sp. MM5496-R1]
MSSGYRTVSASTDEFAHESPWKSIAFAALGGIIIGMLLAR